MIDPGGDWEIERAERRGGLLADLGRGIAALVGIVIVAPIAFIAGVVWLMIVGEKEDFEE